MLQNAGAVLFVALVFQVLRNFLLILEKKLVAAQDGKHAGFRRAGKRLRTNPLRTLLRREFVELREKQLARYGSVSFASSMHEAALPAHASEHRIRQGVVARIAVGHKRIHRELEAFKELADVLRLSRSESGKPNKRRRAVRLRAHGKNVGLRARLLLLRVSAAGFALENVVARFVCKEYAVAALLHDMLHQRLDVDVRPVVEVLKERVGAGLQAAEHHHFDPVDRQAVVEQLRRFGEAGHGDGALRLHGELHVLREKRMHGSAFLAVAERDFVFCIHEAIPQRLENRRKTRYLHAEFLELEMTCRADACISRFRDAEHLRKIVFRLLPPAQIPLLPVGRLFILGLLRRAGV